MSYDTNLVAAKLRRWESYLNHYELPRWEHIPDIGLYMEQVLELLRNYLDYLPPELKEEQFITAPTINNYVRKKIIPMPVRKKYYRIHIAYLIMICSMKHSLSIPTLKTLIPNDLSEAELMDRYTSFADRHRAARQLFIQTAGEVGARILQTEETELTSRDTEEMIMTSAVISGFSRVLAEKLLLLDGKKSAESVL